MKSLGSDKSYNKKGKDSSKKNGKQSADKNSTISFEDARTRLRRQDKYNPNSIQYQLYGGEMMNNFLKKSLQQQTAVKKVEKVQPPKPNSVPKPKADSSKPKPLQVKNGVIKLKEAIELIKEEWSDALYTNVEEYGVQKVLSMFAHRKEGETVPFKPLINPSMYHKALLEFTKNGQLIQFPSKYVYQWIGIIMRNTCILNSLTEVMGHTQANPKDDIIEFVQAYYPRLEAEEADDDTIEVNVSLEDVDKIADMYNQFVDTTDEQTAVESFNEKLYYIGELLIDDSGRLRFRENATDYLLDILGFGKWAVLPDGTTALSDYGLEPLFDICAEFDDDMSAEETLVLINRALDVTHMRGDLASMFIEGGSQALTRISEDIERSYGKRIKLTEKQLKLLKEKLLENKERR